MKLEKNSKIWDHISALFGLSLILFTVLGCGMAPMLKDMKEKSEKPVVLKSTDGKYELTIPGSWKKEKTLHESADIQATKIFEELYVIVISEGKEDFTNDMKLADYTQLLRESMSQNVTSARMTEPTQIIISGNSALRYEIHGVVDKIKVGYISTTIETRRAFHQVIAWTLDSRFEENRNKLLEVVDTFKESVPDASNPPPAKAPNQNR